MFIRVHGIPQPACGNCKQLCVIFIQTAGYTAIITINDYSFVKRSVQDYRHIYFRQFFIFCLPLQLACVFKDFQASAETLVLVQNVQPA